MIYYQVPEIVRYIRCIIMYISAILGCWPFLLYGEIQGRFWFWLASPLPVLSKQIVGFFFLIEIRPHLHLPHNLVTQPALMYAATNKWAAAMATVAIHIQRKALQLLRSGWRQVINHGFTPCTQNTWKETHRASLWVLLLWARTSRIATSLPFLGTARE